MWQEFQDRLINLDCCKEIRLMTDQFGHKFIRVDGTDFTIKNAERMYKKIKEQLIQRGK